jgi:hypothetical protein
MAGNDIQKVRQTGMLWTVSAALGIVRDVLLIITLLGAIALIIMTIPMINSAKGMMDSLGSSGIGQQYGGGNGSQTIGGVNINEVALRMKSEADSGNWGAAMNDMNTLNSISSQLPSDAQNGLRQLEQDIRNHDQASFDSHFDQLMNKYGNQNSSQQGKGTQSGGPSDQLSSIFSRIGASDYKVTYNMQASGNTITMTEYAKGGNTRYDMETSGVSTEIFMLGDQTYSCTQVGGGFMCIKAASSSVPVPAMSAMASAISRYTVSALPDQYIANIEAKCFTLSSSTETGGHNGDYCFSSDGILLSISSSTVTMTATSVERGISDDVFVLPAAVS